MIPLLLLQAVLFDNYTQEAARKLKVPAPTVQVMPLTPTRMQYMAWVGLCPYNFDCGVQRVFIAEDVAANADAGTLRYLAYHEVCHLHEGHYYHSLGKDPSMNHLQVDSCMDRALGREEKRKLQSYYYLFSTYLHRLRARLRP